MYADLHLHTRFSDGTYSPEELAAEGHRLGFAALALTDHDTVDGCPRMALACASLGIEFLPGVEVTTEMDGREFHILAYCVDTEHAALLDLLRTSQASRKDRVRDMVSRLAEIDVPLTEDAVLDLAACESPGRPHVARALVAAGLCASLDEAFARYLKKGRPAWVPKPKPAAQPTIDLIHQAGGVSVLAHPGLNRRDDVIPALVEAGLDGIECLYTRHSTAAVEHYTAIAERHGLLVTGGSDCHGMNKGEPLIGTIKLPYELVERLRSRASAQTRVSPPAPTDS